MPRLGALSGSHLSWGSMVCRVEAKVLLDPCEGTYFPDMNRLETGGGADQTDGAEREAEAPPCRPGLSTHRSLERAPVTGRVRVGLERSFSNSPGWCPALPPADSLTLKHQAQELGSYSGHMFGMHEALEFHPRTKQTNLTCQAESALKGHITVMKWNAWDCREHLPKCHAETVLIPPKAACRP